MKSTEGRIGRVFILRLEDGDVIPECIERFARDKKVLFGQVILLGGVGRGEVIAGPRDGRARPIEPTVLSLDDVHETAALGVIAPGEDGNPVLHLHGALGRGDRAIAGCFRRGVAAWVVCEAVLCEFEGVSAVRAVDPSLGFAVLEPTGRGRKRGDKPEHP